MSALLQNIITPKPTPEEIEAARPLRTSIRQSILDQYTLLEKELPTYYDAGLTYWQMRPIKNFLETEISWWNANIEITSLQVNTRNVSYKEQLVALQKTLQDNLITALKKTPEKSNEILTKLGTVQGFANPPGPATGPAGPAPRLAPALAPGPTLATGPTLAPGPLSTVNLTAVQNSIASVPAVPVALQSPTAWESFLDGLSKGLMYGFIIVYLAFAIRFAAFSANDLLYKPLMYRVIAFIYSMIFFPIMFPYYIYREIVHWIWPSVDAPIIESIFPIIPYDPAEPLTIEKRIYKYPDSVGINTWIANMRQQEITNHLKKLENTSTILQGLIASKAT